MYVALLSWQHFELSQTFDVPSPVNKLYEVLTDPVSLPALNTVQLLGNSVVRWVFFPSWNELGSLPQQCKVLE